MLESNKITNTKNILIAAIESNNLKKVKQILEKDTSLINSFSKDGLSPLHIAIINSDINLVKLLLKYGANPNLPNKNSNHTPLNYAHLHKNSSTKEIIKLLKEYNAKDNTLDDLITSPEKKHNILNININKKNIKKNNDDSKTTIIEMNNELDDSLENESLNKTSQNKKKENIDDLFKYIIIKKKTSLISKKADQKNKNKKILENENSNEDEYYNNYYFSNEKYSNKTSLIYNTDYNRSIENINFTEKENFESSKNNSKKKNKKIPINTITSTGTNSNTKRNNINNVAPENVVIINNNNVTEFKYLDSLSDEEKKNLNNINICFNKLNANHQNNNKIKNLTGLEFWLNSIGLSTYYKNFINNDIFDINILIKQMKNASTKLQYGDIESLLKIHKPGHIYRILCKLESDAGLISSKIVKFMGSKLNYNKNENSSLNYSGIRNNLKISISKDYSCVGCFKINFLNCDLKNDLKSFLKRYNIMNMYQNFYHNGFDNINFVILQMYSSFSITEETLENCFHIYDLEQRAKVMQCLMKEVNKIDYFLNSEQYLNCENKELARYENIIFQNEDDLEQIKINNTSKICTECLIF